MRILYFGNDHPSSTCCHRAEALRRLGHEVLHFNPFEVLTGIHAHPLLTRIHYRSGFRFTDGIFRKWLGEILDRLPSKPDLCWVSSGEHFSKNFILMLRSLKCPVILYNNDDPTGTRDRGLWRTLLQALPYYDLCVTRRHPTEIEMQQRGARKTLRVWMSYDEVRHSPPQNKEEIPAEFHSDVAFIGTWMRNENRHVHLRRLMDEGLDVKIWGARWNKAPDKQLLDACLQGGPLSGRPYVHAIAGAKICLGLLSHGNRDEHTRRSVEIPFAGGLLCAERTNEHLKLYEDGMEAVFWNDSEECVACCSKLLADDALREQIRFAGFTKVRSLKVGNEDICRQVLDVIFPSCNLVR